jgi:hypothetical protein
LVAKKPVKKPIEPWRHSANCKICNSDRRAEIEQAFLQWQPPTTIAKQYGLNRLALYRHAHATGLYDKRGRNIRAMLLSVVDAGITARMRVTSAAVVSAVGLLSKLDSEGRAVERVQMMDGSAEFIDDPRWTIGEMEEFCRSGKLPKWLTTSETPLRALQGQLTENTGEE